ncbi:MAG: glycoside hydrolase family 1 protein, partial [Catenulispora sp.]|nr:glycoside hydrolase family 1 protein [Catenulispora sp.]
MRPLSGRTRACADCETPPAWLVVARGSVCYVARVARVSILSAVLSVVVAVGVGAGVAGSAPADPAPLGRDFLWGVASSGFQSEGDSPDSNWRRFQASGQTPDKVGGSVDFRHRYPGDIRLAAGLGARVYRIGIEWARLQPRPGQWDEQAFRYYDDVIAKIRSAGMRPMLTLDHWVYPGWAVDRGGWRNAAMVSDWLANARKVVDRYAKANPLWVTFNETFAYLLQESRLGGIGPAEVPMMSDKLVAAHGGIYDYIHAKQPGALVTSNVAYLPTAEPAIDAGFLDRVAHRLDYVGIDYYYGASLADVGGLAAAANNELWKAPLTAEGIYYALRHYARKFPGRPLYVVENGIPTENGAPRADGYTRGANLRDTAYWLQRARADGMNVMGYNYWSLTDNYEWGSYTPRFGLYTVDVKTDPTLARRPTDAVAAYR